MDFVFNLPMTRKYNSKMSTTDIRCEALGATFRKGQRNGNWRKLVNALTTNGADVVIGSRFHMKIYGAEIQDVG